MKPPSDISHLQKTARAHGIQTSFIDSVGQEQFASDATLRLILERLGVDAAEPKLPAVEPVLVSWQKTKAPLKTRACEKPRRIELQLAQSDKRAPIRNFRAHQLPTGEFDLELPLSDLPTGYHDLIFATKSGEHRSLLISAPRKLYADPTRQWGMFLPLYAAHSKNSWGAGNLTDWKELSHWVGAQGGKVVGTLPIMAAFLDYPKCEPSPYSPASRLFWNEFFIDVTAIPEFQNSRAAQKLVAGSAFQRKLAKFRASELIDYPAEWKARRAVLEILAREFFESDSPRRTEFNAYIRERPQVADYAKFRAACEKKRAPWQTWSYTAKTGKISSADFDEPTYQFYLYIQCVAQQQVDGVLASCRADGVKFYLDLPLGVNPDGFDAWRYREFFARDVNAGAPPDAFFTKGQDWGFAPLDPRRTRELRYQYVIDYLRFQMRHTGLLRIDHVMGLHRLWWVPHGHPASAGAYVRYPADELYAILSVESHRHKTMLVGENLGTVPPEVNKSMDRHGLRRMYVLQYEQTAEGPLRAPEPHEVASVNTHDMPMFAAHWRGLDILDRADLGLIPPSDLPREKRRRAQLRKNLVAFLRSKKLLTKNSVRSRDILIAILKFLAQSPSETVLVTLEDLWGEERSQNVPGTSFERPNWRRKASQSLEEITTSKQVRSVLQEIAIIRNSVVDPLNHSKGEFRRREREMDNGKVQEISYEELIRRVKAERGR
jgi:4-alpha-glucanotransferase